MSENAYVKCGVLIIVTSNRRDEVGLFIFLETNYIYLVQRGLIEKIYSVKRIFRCPFHISGFEKNDIT